MTIKKLKTQLEKRVAELEEKAAGVTATVRLTLDGKTIAKESVPYIFE